MRAVVQRAKHTSLRVNGELISEIPFGLVVFLGIKVGDTEKEAEYLAKKIAALRIFEDGDGKMNLSVKDVGGEILFVSQFTLYADCRHGNRPGFTDAADPGLAEELYEYLIDICRREIPVVEQGKFGAEMKVELVNDGPFTILLDSEMYREKK